MIVLALLLLGIVVAVVFFFTAAGRTAQDKTLGQSGIAAQAKVLELTKTGVNRGPNMPLMHLKLEVSPPQGAPYTVEQDLGIHVADLPRFQPGAAVMVRIDPQDASRLVIEEK
jgi:hypothetical protein